MPKAPAEASARRVRPRALAMLSRTRPTPRNAPGSPGPSPSSPSRPTPAAAAAAVELAVAAVTSLRRSEPVVVDPVQDGSADQLSTGAFRSPAAAPAGVRAALVWGAEDPGQGADDTEVDRGGSWNGEPVTGGGASGEPGTPGKGALDPRPAPGRRGAVTRVDHRGHGDHEGGADKPESSPRARQPTGRRTSSSTTVCRELGSCRVTVGTSGVAVSLSARSVSMQTRRCGGGQAAGQRGGARDHRGQHGLRGGRALGR